MVSSYEEGIDLKLQFDKRGGLLPVAVQEFSTGQVLMIASVSQEAFDKTVTTGKATFWSTSRKGLWTKGETSGNYLEIKKILIDCDQDALVYQVELMGGGVCHTFNKNGENRKACFYREYSAQEDKLDFIEE